MAASRRFQRQVRRPADVDAAYRGLFDRREQARGMGRCVGDCVLTPGWRSWMREVPLEFWTSPASASGTRHHGESQIEHAEEVYALCAWHWRRVPERHIRAHHGIRRSFLRAARFHDVGKAEDRSAHDIAGYNFMLRRDPLAAYFILRHMGRWGSREVADIINCKPIAQYHAVPVFRWLADLLQACDYTAAHGWQRQ